MAYGKFPMRFLPALVLSTALSTVPALAQPTRRIAVDMSEVTGPRDMAWQDCIGADHSGILLRPDNLALLKLVHDETGFQFIRFHGIFNDDMEAYREVLDVLTGLVEDVDVAQLHMPTNPCPAVCSLLTILIK